MKAMPVPMIPKPCRLVCALLAAAWAATGAGAAVYYGPLFVTEGLDAVPGKIHAYDALYNTFVTLRQEDNVRYNAAAVDNVNGYLYYAVIPPIGSSNYTNQLWRMDLTPSSGPLVEATSANWTPNAVEHVGNFVLDADHANLLGATFANGRLFLVTSHASAVWSVPVATLDSYAASLQTEVFTSIPNSYQTTTLRTESGGTITGFQPGDIEFDLTNNRFWFQGSLGGYKIYGWNDDEILAAAAASGIRLVNNDVDEVRPGLTIDNGPQPASYVGQIPAVGTMYSWDKNTGNVFTIYNTNGLFHEIVDSGNKEQWAVWGDMTAFASVTVVPEAGSALVGLLLAAGILRRRRA